MFNRYSLGATVLGIFSLAVFGIIRAFAWLSESPNPDSFADRSEFVEVAPSKRSKNEGPRSAGDDFVEDTRVRDGRDDELALTFAEDQATSPSDNTSSDDRPSDNRFLEDVLDQTPLETAGTANQRQNDVQFEPLTTDSQVEATPPGTVEITSTEATSTQGDIQSEQLVSPNLSDASSKKTDAENIGPAAPDSQPVPALW